MNETHFIIFPGGDRTKLSVVSLNDAMRYEINDYARASREEFHEIEEAVEYAKLLATEHGLSYIGDDDGYLD